MAKDRDSNGRFIKGHKIRLGMKHSEETKQKFSKSQKGIKELYSSHRKGLTFEQEYGFERAKQIKNKSSISHKESECISNSIRNLGRYSKKGWHHIDKTKLKLSQNKERARKISEKLTGRKLSEETKIEMRLKTKERWQNPEYRKKVLGRRIPSSLEKKFIDIIDKLNLPYKFVGNGQFFIERFNPDFINCNGEKIAIEVFYRKHKEQFRNGLEEWKQKRQEIFNNYGWKILFFDEMQVNENFIIKNLLGDKY